MNVHRAPDAMLQDLSAFFSKLEVTPREPPSAEIARRLLAFLLSGTIQPGTRIPSERKLAESLGVGRSAVREAIASLNLLGLLEIRQGDGTYLTASGSDILPRVIEWGLILGHSRLLDVVELRYHLEVVVAGLAASRATDESIDGLRQIVKRMREARDPTAFADADLAFHLCIAEASGNEVLLNVIRSIQSLLRVWMTRTIEYAGETGTSVDMHIPILEAIAGHDSERARLAMAAHMTDAGARLRTILADE